MPNKRSYNRPTREYYDAEKDIMVKLRHLPPKPQEASMKNTIDSIFKTTINLRSHEHYILRKHIFKSRLTFAFLRIKDYQSFREKFLNIKHIKWTQAKKDLAKRNTVTKLDKHIWTGLGFLLNGLNNHQLSAVLGQTVAHKNIINSVIVVKEMYQINQDTNLNKPFTIDEIFDFEHDFWEIFQLQGIFGVLDIFIEKGSRGGSLVAGLVLMTAKLKIRWGEEIPFVQGETDEDIFNKSKLKAELKSISKLDLAIKCRLGHAHAIRMHVYGDTKLDLKNEQNAELNETILNPHERTAINYEGFNSDAKLNLNIARNRVRCLIELLPICGLQACQHLQRHYDYNDFSDQFYDYCFETLCLRYNNMKHRPPVFANYKKEPKKAERMTANPNIVTNDLYACLFVDNIDKPIRKNSKIYLPKTDTIMSTQKIQKPVSKRENLTTPFIMRVTKAEKLKMLEHVDEITDIIKKRCAEEGRPCIL